MPIYVGLKQKLHIITADQAVLPQVIGANFLSFGYTVDVYRLTR